MFDTNVTCGKKILFSILSILLISSEARSQTISLEVTNDPIWSQSDFENAEPATWREVSPLSHREAVDNGIEIGRLIPAAIPSTPTRAPIVNVDPFPAQIKPEIPITDAGTAVGTLGAYFSSSRLIPQSARTEWPYRASGKIRFKDGGLNYICSGFVIGYRLVGTAGHCIHNGSSNGFHSDVEFIPAYENGQAPLGVWKATWLATTTPWSTSNGDVPNEADFGIFEVDDQVINGNTMRIGDVTGIYSFRLNALSNNQVKIIGYPGSIDSGEIMHQVDTGDPLPGGSNTMMYGSDMTGGSSGGPWIENFGIRSVGQPNTTHDQRNTVVGITSYGYRDGGVRLAQGTSILNGDFQTLYNDACARNTRNCNP